MQRTALSAIAGLFSVAVVTFAALAGEASAAIAITSSSVGGVVIPFDTAGPAAAQTAPYGITVFASNSFATTQGISGLFTGNANAPIGPPSALQLGPTPHPATYFHFSPLSGYEINSIGISATGAFLDRSTTFRVFAADEDLNSIQFDVPMIPTTSGIAGLNGGAVFLGVQSTAPITAFRVWQLDGGFGILDNLVVDVTAVGQASNVPEPASLAVWSLLGLCAAYIVRRSGSLTATGVG